MTPTIRTMEQWFSKRLLSLVFIAWVLAYAWLLNQDRYMAFLQPRFRGLMYMGLFISGVFALVSVLAHSSGQDGEETSGAWIRGGFLILPILFLVGAHNTTLGGYALSKRPLGTSVPGLTLEEKILRDDPSLWTMDIRDLPPVHEPEKPVLLSKLLRNWKDYEGKEVLTEGMYHAPKDSPEGYGMVFRFYVTCCAADAVPVGIFARGKGLDSLKNDQWVRVRGIVRLEPILGQELPSMEVSQVEKLPPPATGEQYLYF
ncbi:MAG: TIGR03943 family protein [Desulfatibacillum sp.]|nr:TIGR03943 family protein [Desulfatibacillum sp.]